MRSTCFFVDYVFFALASELVCSSGLRYRQGHPPVLRSCTQGFLTRAPSGHASCRCCVCKHFLGSYAFVAVVDTFGVGWPVRRSLRLRRLRRGFGWASGGGVKGSFVYKDLSPNTHHLLLLLLPLLALCGTRYSHKCDVLPFLFGDSDCIYKRI